MQAHLQDKPAKELAFKNDLYPTNRQPSNAGGFRRLAFTKPASNRRKEKKQQVNPALRLPAGRYGQLKINQ
jgi:hypothetical protein